MHYLVKTDISIVDCKWLPGFHWHSLEQFCRSSTCLDGTGDRTRGRIRTVLDFSWKNTGRVFHTRTVSYFWPQITIRVWASGKYIRSVYGYSAKSWTRPQKLHVTERPTANTQYFRTLTLGPVRKSSVPKKNMSDIVKINWQKNQSLPNLFWRRLNEQKIGSLKFSVGWACYS